MKKGITMLALFIGLLFAFGSISTKSVYADYDDVSFESPDAPTQVDW